MRLLRVLAATALFSVSAGSSFGACNFTVTATSELPNLGYRLSWQPVAGATNYEVQTSSDGFSHVATTLIDLPAGTSGAPVNRLTTGLHGTYSYRIIASDPSNASFTRCTGCITVGYAGTVNVLSQ